MDEAVNRHAFNRLLRQRERKIEIRAVFLPFGEGLDGQRISPLAKFGLCRFKYLGQPLIGPRRNR